LGTTCGVGLQLLLVVAGMAAVIEVAAAALIWIRWLGVAYLVWLGVRTWRTPANDLERLRAAPVVFGRGFVLAVINPKTLLFNAAFIPQFVTDGSLLQFLTVTCVYLGIVLAGDLAWALFASSAKNTLGRYRHWRNRVSGSVLIAAGVGLALSRR
jgi:threonine/homoserine/homoserine lactone efflux protein